MSTKMVSTNKIKWKEYYFNIAMEIMNSTESINYIALKFR